MLKGEMIGDFLGFTLDNKNGENPIHSSEFNIVRVSDGSRYNENLLPDFSDKTVQIGGRDETYYFGSDYTQRSFNIEFAFDSLSKQDIIALKQWLSSKMPYRLYFDEDCVFDDTEEETEEKLIYHNHDLDTQNILANPSTNILKGKYYMVKISSAPTIKYVAFDEGDGIVYKGEGTINFVAFYPFAFDHIIKTTQFATSGGRVNITNNGDLPIDWKVWIPIPSNKNINNFQIQVGDSTKVLDVGSFVTAQNEQYLLINSKSKLIEGFIDKNTRSGNIYNSTITGDFYQLPLGITWIQVTSLTGNLELEYQYIYY